MPFSGIGGLAREDRHRNAEQRRDGLLAEKALVAIVIGMGGHSDAGWKQLGTRRRDHKCSILAVDTELDVVKRAGLLAILDIGLGERHLEIDIPHEGRVDVVDVPFLEEIPKAQLREPPAVIVDRRVGLAPVDGEAGATPDLHEGLLVFFGDAVAEFDEVLARNLARSLLAHLCIRGFEREARLVGNARIAAHVKIVLHAALGGNARCRPNPSGRRCSARACAGNAPRYPCGCRKKCDPICSEPGDRRRRGVDDEGLVAGARGVVSVGPPGLPAVIPALLGLDRLEVLRESVWVDRSHALGCRELISGSKKGSETGKSRRARGVA